MLGVRPARDFAIGLQPRSMTPLETIPCAENLREHLSETFRQKNPSPPPECPSECPKSVPDTPKALSGYDCPGPIQNPKFWNPEIRKILVSVKFLSAILGSEMAAPMLWAPGKNALFLQEKQCP